ncbi:hypothetical protein [Myxococcus sp. AB025B]|uniref:hypothetical protein n=1 Tax=Myxococcus sp. AB025B TaxID=2562794 RepID=UPI001143A915|nr:hypothetical protein [Myxococcus sp. AB025B]
MDEIERAELIAGVLSNMRLPRKAALDAIEKQRPGATARLSKLWTAYSRQSLFLWAAPTLQRFESEVDTRNAVAAAVRASTKQDFHPAQLTEHWVRLEEQKADARLSVVEEDEEDEAPSEIVPPRVVSVRSGPQSIDATVRLTKHLHVIYEDTEKAVVVTQDVGLSLELGAQGRLMKVYGGNQASRKAVRAFVEWVTGEPLPQRNPALARHLVAVQFTEGHVMALADRLQLDFVGMSGSDARDVVGKVSFEGKLDGFRLAPLDVTDDRIKSQEDMPQDLRVYNWDYEHPEDKFVEYGRVAFVMNARHSYLNFLVRTSQAAMADVVRELWAEVRP